MKISEEKKRLNYVAPLTKAISITPSQHLLSISNPNDEMNNGGFLDE